MYYNIALVRIRVTFVPPGLSKLPDTALLQEDGLWPLTATTNSKTHWGLRAKCRYFASTLTKFRFCKVIFIKSPVQNFTDIRSDTKTNWNIRTDRQIWRANSRLSTTKNAPKQSARYRPHLHSHSTFRYNSSSNIQTRAAICLLASCSFW